MINDHAYDDMGPCTSMAIQAESDEQFMRLSFKLRRTSRLRRSSMDNSGVSGGALFGNSNTNAVHNVNDNVNVSLTRQFLREAAACHTFALPKSALLVRDDTGIPQNNAPEACVDYLSHDWSNGEVINSWKFIRLVRHTPATDKGYIRRLENLSWRMWNRIQHIRQCPGNSSCLQLRTDDSTLQIPSLYGPLVHTDSVCRDSIQSSLRASPNTVIKPILKKRNLGQSLEDTARWRARFGSGVAALAHSASAALNKRIRFKSTVEQCIAVYTSQTHIAAAASSGIEQLPTAPLNYYSDSDSECECDPPGSVEPGSQEYTHYNYTNAVSHNVNTLRRYPYIYDYNSVYTQENLSRYLPKDQTCDIIDIPSQLSAAIAPAPPAIAPGAISTTPSMSPVVQLDYASPQTLPDSCTTDTSLQTLGKTRDFITGEVISDAETPPATPTLFRSMPPTPTLAASFIFTSDDDSDY